MTHATVAAAYRKAAENCRKRAAYMRVQADKHDEEARQYDLDARTEDHLLRMRQRSRSQDPSMALAMSDEPASA